MKNARNSGPDARRRALLQSMLAAGGLALLPRIEAQAGDGRILQAKAGRAALVGAPYPETDVWTYDATVPGPELRFKQGERLQVTLENLLPDDTTVHWHGIRLPNAMDGVPHLTQPPIAARGGRFSYEFALPDAGTYWYHPHLGSPEQVGRGLAGALVIEEAEPPAVDRDVVWVLGDWRLNRNVQIVDNFGNFMDASHAGRIGNTVTVNGAIREAFELRAGERVRLRLINAANARIFALDFRGHDPWVIALDGHPVEPHRPANGRVVLAPAMRADVLLDASGTAGEKYPIVDDFYPRRAYRVLDLSYEKDTRRSGHAAKALPKLAPNTMPEPELDRAKRHQIVFGGGMMGSMPRGASRHGMAWTVNGEPMRDHRHEHEPILKLGLGRSYVIELVNDTQWHHPIHVHGHAFRVLSRDRRPTHHREWLDTVLLGPQERAEIALVADNPGDWMIHCHVLEHQASGMMAVFSVA